jgi:cytochrome P450
MSSVLGDIPTQISSYYSQKIGQFGSTPRGVDWSCAATQNLRFVQLLRICDFAAPFSLNDVGCGYGALVRFLAKRQPDAHIDYLGIDLAAAMVRRARRLHRNAPHTSFVVGAVSPRLADYSVASGIMNVKLDTPRDRWEAFVAATLRSMHHTSRHGFAVNFMAEGTTCKASPEQLYRTSPEVWSRYCESGLGCAVEILSSYGMREFTLLVRRKEDDKQSISQCQSHVDALRYSGRQAKPHRAPPAPKRNPVPLQVGDANLREAVDTIISPDGHADDTRLNLAFRLLRQKSPVHWVEYPGVRPFWAVTRHADLLSVERRPADFAVAPRTVLSSELVEIGFSQVSGKPQIIRSLPQMDDPDHSAYRALTQKSFSPPSLAGLEGWLAEWARQAVDRIAEHDIVDFAADVAVPYAIGVISRILGVPATDERLLLKLAGGVLGADDPDRRLADLPTDSMRIAMQGYRDYFDGLAADRRVRPRGDVATILANATVNGKAIPDHERVSYYVVIASGGFETTALAIAGGLYALAEHPDQLEQLQANPSLLQTAVEEMLRWTSPARHFVRTATRDTELGGRRISSGEAVAIFFSSANRDETVFADPDSFRVDRAPNPHVTFGKGPHVCLGHHLSRMEMIAFYRELLWRLERVEVVGPVRRAPSAFVSGITSLPVRLTMRRPDV